MFENTICIERNSENAILMQLNFSLVSQRYRYGGIFVVFKSFTQTTIKIRLNHLRPSLKRWGIMRFILNCNFRDHYVN